MLLTESDDLLARILEAIERGGVPDAEVDDLEPIELDPVARLTERTEQEPLTIEPLEPFVVGQKTVTDTRPITSVPAQERAVVQHGVEPTFRPGRWMKDYDNGHIPQSVMTPLGGGHYARPDVAKAFKAMRRSMKRDGLTLSITDSYRSYDEQVALKAQKPTLAATPGKSNHGWGIAFDINVNDPRVYKWLKNNGKRFGFEQPMSYEPWHWEYHGGFKGAKKVKNLGNSAPKPRSLGGQRSVNDITTASLVTAPTVFGSLMSEVENPGSSPRDFDINPQVRGLKFVPSKYRKLFTAAAEEYGISARLLASVAQIESNFNPKAVSSAGAQGIMQIMPLHGLENPFNAKASIFKGAEILASYISGLGLRNGLAAYNAGPNNYQAGLDYADKVLEVFRRG